MRIKLLLLSFSLCVQTEGQAAVKELEILGFATARRVVHQMKRPVSTLSSFQHHSTQQFSTDIVPATIIKHSSIQQQKRMLSSVAHHDSLDNKIYKFLSNCNTEIYSVNSGLSYISNQICQTILGLQEVKGIGYLRELDELIGSWCWKMAELKEQTNITELKRLETPINRLASIVEDFEKENMGISNRIYSHKLLLISKLELKNK